MQFDLYTLLLLTRPSDAPELSEAEANVLQDAHLANQARLQDEGFLLAAGPLTDQDDERFRGFAVLNVDPGTARQLYGSDPAVQAGRFAVEVMTWFVPAGIVRFDKGRLPRSLAEARG